MPEVRDMTMMQKEAAEAAEVVQAQLDRNGPIVERIGSRLREIEPRLIVTCARGSSDHAATFGKYLLESSTGLFTASAAPSIHSVYERDMHFENALCVFISQSGASPDLLAAAEAARHGGAFVVALVNVDDSPLASLAHEVLPLRAGEEISVAATKSFIASLAALVHLASNWCADEKLDKELRGVPSLLHEAWNCDWSAAVEPIACCRDLYVLARGIGLGIAQESALKFKEVCGLHAEAFSAAEVLHGPIAIAGDNFPMLVYAQNDKTRPGIDALLETLTDRGMTLITAGVTKDGAINLPTPASHPAIEPMLRIQSFYRMANELSIRLGRNPDTPPHLKKVTATV
jgi:glucosamine--fructose-6-phosphate aminotransferase (isomerizing)